ncbi:MAG TPA: SMP-30/gluconolactonase/LRE family protein [Actinomycetota bacterium]
MSKPPIHPARRVVPKAPPRASARRSEEAFPPARPIPLPGYGPEDVVPDGKGGLLTGLADGRILRVDPTDDSVELVADTGGRPLGFEPLADGRFLVCDSHRGLLRLDPSSGDLETLVESVDGRRLMFCSNAAAQSDGTIWFTESTSRFHIEHYVGSMLEHRATGALFRRDADGTVEVVVRDLFFANGLSLTEDESALIFAETAGYRISRVDIRGPNAGKAVVIADNLPAFPDNISHVERGRFWAALPNPRNPLLDRLSNSPGVVRKLVWATPDRLKPAGRKTTWVMQFDDEGRVVRDLQEERPDFHMVTGVTEFNGKLYLSSIEESALLEVDLSRG